MESQQEWSSDDHPAFVMDRQFQNGYQPLKAVSVPIYFWDKLLRTKVRISTHLAELMMRGLLFHCCLSRDSALPMRQGPHMKDLTWLLHGINVFGLREELKRPSRYQNYYCWLLWPRRHF